MKKTLLLPILFQVFFFSSILQQGFAQTVIDFENPPAIGAFIQSISIDEFTFAANISTSYGIGFLPLGVGGSVALIDENRDVNGLTRWTITKNDGGEFQFRSVFLQRRNFGSSSGTIIGRKNGNPVGSAKPINFNGVQPFVSDPDFYDVDEIWIEADEIYIAIDDFTYGSVVSTNTAPIATAPTAPSVTEDAVNIALANDIQVTDIDGDNQTVTFTITGGTVSLGTAGITFGGGGNGSASFTASGTLAAINTALDAATFTPTPNLFGTNAGTISFISNDGTVNSNTATVSFTITGVNDAPVATAPTAPTVTEDAVNVALADNIQVTDVDGDNQTVTFTITGGTVSLGTAGITFGGGGNGSASFTASGTLAAINTALDAATFTPTPNLFGTNAGTISFISNDGTVNSNTATVSFTITGVNDAPVATAPTAPTVTEDAVNVALANNIQVADVDGDNQTLTFTITGGTVSLGTAGITFGGGGNGSASFTASGTLAAINAALDAATFTPTPNLFGTNSGTISFISNDGTVNSNTATVTFSIAGVNDNPTVTGLPSSVTITEDASDAEFNISAGTISDIDAGTGQLTLKLEATGGVFDVASGTGITIIGHLSSTLNLTGNLTDLNTYIDIPSNIYFKPDLNLSGNGAASVNVFINDNGNTGSGGGTDILVGTVSVNITPVNDAPSDILLSSNTIPENQPINTLVGSLSGIDPDTGDIFTFTFVPGVGADDNGSYSISGNQLRTAEVFDFAVKNSYTIRIRITDQGGLFYEEAFTITVNEENEAPTNLLINNNTIAENSAIGTAVGTFSGVDPNTGDTFTYSFAPGLGDVDNGAFSISGDQLRTAAGFDFETKNSYSIRVRVTDLGSLSFERQLTISVTNVNEAPTVTAPMTIGVFEDEPQGLTSISFSDVDAGSNAVTATFSVTSGTLSATDGGGVTVGGTSTERTLSGALNDINTFISAGNLTFTTALNSTLDVTLDITINDNGNSGTGSALSDDATVTIEVTAVNDAPVNTVPLVTQQIDQDVALTFNSGNGNLISVSDVDAGSNDVLVSLVATNGTMTLSTTTGLSFSTGSGTNDATLNIAGSLTAINAALNGMIFTPTPGYNGPASITITTSDQGFSGSGGDQSDTDVISITVNSINPVITSVTSTGPDGTYKIGDEISIQVNFDQAVVVNTGGGTPSLLLETGTTDRQATYVSGSGSTTLNFAYTVQEGDFSADLDYSATTALLLNGSTIQNASGDNAVLTLPTPGAAGSLGANKALVIDGIRPTASIVVADNLLSIGETSLVTITFSERISIFGNGNLSISNGTLSPVSSGDGGFTWTGTFTPTADVEDPSNVITLNNAGIADEAGNSGTGITESNEFAIDTQRPTVTIVVQDDQLIVGETSLVTITFSEAITGLTAADFIIENGTLSDPESEDGDITWTATLTPVSGVEDATNVIRLDNAGIEDKAGNAGSGLVTTTSNNYLVDTQVPTVNTQNITVPLNANGTVSITAIQIDNNSTDGFGIATLALNPTDFDCSDIGTNTVTLTVTDVNGNQARGTAIVTIEDNTLPVVTTQNIRIELDATGNASILAADINNGSSDACGIQSISLSQTDFDCSDVGPNTVTLTVTDVNGNQASGTAIVTVEDNTPPVVTTQNITIQLDPTGNASILAADINNGSSDACGIQSISLSQTDFDCSDVGPNTVTLTVTDVNGNQANGTAIVTVEDNTPPVVTTQNITIQLDPTGNASIIAADINNGSSDACGIQSITLSQTDFDCSDVGPNTVTLTVTDNNGNQATGTATVTVEDNTAPVVTTQNITIQQDATGNATITANQLNNGSADACGIQSITVSKSSFDCSNVGANTVTLTVTDVNGNQATGTATVTVEDNTAPVVTTQNITIQLDATGNATITANQLNNGSADACGIQSITVSKSSFDCTNIGANTVTLTVTDVNGNQASGTATVTVEDNTAPVVNTQNITIQLDATGNATITANQLNNGSADACGIQSITVSKSSFDCTNIGANTVILTVVDVNGNQASGTATVTVEDTLAPVPVLNQLPAITATCQLQTLTAPTALDNCGGTITATTNAVLPITDSTVITWTFTDQSGNQSSQTQQILIVDTTAPVITGVPEDFEVILYSNQPYVLPDFTQIAQATDNCTLISFRQTPAAGTVYSQPGEVVVTLTAIDRFNNKTEVSFTITLSNRLIIGLENPAMITVPWNTPASGLGLPSTVEVSLSNGERTSLPVTWNTTGYNQLLSAIYQLRGTLTLGDIENPDDFRPSILILVEDKLPPTDIILSNSEFGANTSINEVIGLLTTVDPQDNVHSYQLINPATNDGKYFRIEGNALYLNTQDPLPGQTSFTLVVRSTDRVGNFIDRTFVLTRTRIPVNQVVIFNSFTPNGDGLNDTWGIPDLQFFRGGRVQVFDRDGRRVFYTESPANRWDGSYQGKELPTGAYIWILESRETGEIRRGTLTLIRD